MNKYLTTAGICLATMLTACGGGGSDSSNSGPPASDANTPARITSVTPDRLMFSRRVSFTVVGTALDRGLSLTSAGCGSPTIAAGGTNTQRVISCTPIATGNITLNFSLTGLATPFVSTQFIPVPQVTMKTTLGDLVMQLAPTNAPITVNNFLQYVNDGFYNTLTFHRVIPDFVIQGGGFNALLQTKITREPIRLESVNGLRNVRGSIAMARAGDPNSATSQFFFNVKDNSADLDGNTRGGNGFAVFGQLISGLEVMDAISRVPTNSPNAAFMNVPIVPVTITSATQTQ